MWDLLLMLAVLGGVYAYTYLDPLWQPFLDQVFQFVVDGSTLGIESIEICECDQAGFTMSMVSRIANTGPLPAEIDGFQVALSSTMGPTDLPEDQRAHSLQATTSTPFGKPFANVLLPPLQARPDGATLTVTAQRVEITSHKAYDHFNARLINDEEFPLYMYGRTRVSVMGGRISGHVRYAKTVVVRGMGGLSIDVVETRKRSRSVVKGRPTEVENEVVVHNRSRIAVDLGRVHVAVLFKDKPIVNLETDLFLRPGPNKTVLWGHLVLANMINPAIGIPFLKQDLETTKVVEAVVVGRSATKCKWIDTVVRQMRTPIVLDGTMRDLLSSVKRSSATHQEADSRPISESTSNHTDETCSTASSSSKNTQHKRRKSLASLFRRSSSGRSLYSIIPENQVSAPEKVTSITPGT
ncbi:hypothetical protein PYCC9005_003863 [Savitreella phatthalungensis]